jgi:hypothetical protein
LDAVWLSRRNRSAKPPHDLVVLKLQNSRRDGASSASDPGRVNGIYAIEKNGNCRLNNIRDCAWTRCMRARSIVPKHILTAQVASRLNIGLQIVPADHCAIDHSHRLQLAHPACGHLCYRNSTGEGSSMLLVGLWVARKRCVDIERNLPPFLTPWRGLLWLWRLNIRSRRAAETISDLTFDIISSGFGDQHVRQRPTMRIMIVWLTLNLP